MHNGITQEDGSRAIEARDAIAVIASRKRYRRLVRLLPECLTADGRINKSALARRLRVTTERVSTLIEEIRRLQTPCTLITANSPPSSSIAEKTANAFAR